MATVSDPFWVTLARSEHSYRKDAFQFSPQRNTQIGSVRNGHVSSGIDAMEKRLMRVSERFFNLQNNLLDKFASSAVCKSSWPFVVLTVQSPLVTLLFANGFRVWDVRCDFSWRSEKWIKRFRLCHCVWLRYSNKHKRALDTISIEMGHPMHIVQCALKFSGKHK